VVDPLGGGHSPMSENRGEEDPSSERTGMNANDQRPNYLKGVTIDPAGIVPSAAHLTLPYGLATRDFFRAVEDAQSLLGDLNDMLYDKHYGSLVNLMDRAAFSGLVSRTVAERLARASRRLVVNRYHNGYPDLIVDGAHPNNSVRFATDGLEVKASRKRSNWQAHGPRAGWFCFAQFRIDERKNIASDDLEPVSMEAIMVAQLREDDWNWQPAKPGKIRSGTASVRPSGLLKIRQGAIWIDPAHHAAFYKRMDKLIKDQNEAQPA
jgi:hypothetical protein